MRAVKYPTVAKQHKYGLHLGLVVAELVCGSAFYIELSRALAGNTLSWAYVFEWPFLGGYAVYMWRNLLRDNHPTASAALPNSHDDEKLAAFNDYLAHVHASTPSTDETPTK